MDKRLKTVNKFARDLRKISNKYDCAVLTINQFTRKLKMQSGSSQSSNSPVFQLVSSLGATWRNHLDTCINLNGDANCGR